MKEEGFSVADYQRGIHLLKNKDLFHPLTAICLPGVGDFDIISAVSSICVLRRSFLITTERDFYDFITDFNRQ